MADYGLSKRGDLRFEHGGHIISVSRRLPVWDAHKVAYWPIGNEKPEAMKCPRVKASDSLVKRIAKAVAAIDRRNAK